MSRNKVACQREKKLREVTVRTWRERVVGKIGKKEKQKRWREKMGSL